eukprot:XP_024438259.1 uncharacterized protein LOC112323296 isoform X1 [Populus trichocarpa]
MGCGGGPWVLALLSTEALIFYYKEKNSNRDLEEGRDRRRLKLLTLTDYGKEQDMGIEALEAMLMDDEFREIHSRESGLHTSNHLFKISISPQVRLAGCSSWCCVFSVPWSLAMFLCYASLVVLFWILSSISFLLSGKKR